MVSTNLPSGSKAVRNHTEKLVTNVSPEADKAFMGELKREDLKRYQRLLKNMRQDLQLHSQESQDKRYCLNTANGSHPLPPDARKNAQYCSPACKQEAYRTRAA